MKELILKLNSDKSFSHSAYLELKKNLDEETAKPLKKWDMDKIAELSSQIAVFTNVSDDFSEKVSTQIPKQRNFKISFMRFMKPVVSFACVASIFLGLNQVSVHAFDLNLLSATIQKVDGGFNVKFNKTNEKNNNDFVPVHLPASSDDPYGIIAECAKYGIIPETPHYLPEGFELKFTDGNIDKNFSTAVSFSYHNEKKNINLLYEYFWTDAKGIHGIPSDYYNVTETTVNGHDAIVSKEDNQFTLVYEYDNFCVTLFTQDVEYDECDKIVASIY